MCLHKQRGVARDAGWMMVAVLAAILVKEVAWVFWIPAGAITGELDHYRSAETIRLAKRFVRDRASYTEKDVFLVEDYARLRDDRAPVRTAADRRSLERALESSRSVHVLVPYQGGGQSTISAPGYHALLGYSQALLERMDVRWRWVALRLLSTSFLLVAVWFTYVAARVLFASNRIPALAGAVVVGYGPWAGLGGSLIGPGSLAAALWAAWLWQVGCTVRRQTGWSIVWLALIAFALSSVSATGFLAALCTFGGALLMTRRRLRKQLMVPLLACLLALACVAFWIYRFTSFDGGSWPTASTVSGFVFGNTGFVVRQPPVWIGVLDCVIGALLVVGALVAAMRRSLPRWTVIGALGLVLILPVFQLAHMGLSGTLLTICPALGLLSAVGVSEFCRRFRYGVSLLVAVLAVSDLGLFLWWIQRVLS